MTELEAIWKSDNRRAPEFTAAINRLTADNAGSIVQRGVVGGAETLLLLPNPRLVALRDALKLRTKLDLPTMDAPDV